MDGYGEVPTGDVDLGVTDMVVVERTGLPREESEQRRGSGSPV